MTTTRRVSTPWRIADELRGRTLRELTRYFTCESCDRVAVWPDRYDYLREKRESLEALASARGPDRHRSRR